MTTRTEDSFDFRTSDETTAQLDRSWPVKWNGPAEKGDGGDVRSFTKSTVGEGAEGQADLADDIWL